MTDANKEDAFSFPRLGTGGRCSVIAVSPQPRRRLRCSRGSVTPVRPRSPKCRGLLQLRRQQRRIRGQRPRLQRLAVIERGIDHRGHPFLVRQTLRAKEFYQARDRRRGIVYQLGIGDFKPVDVCLVCGRVSAMRAQSALELCGIELRIRLSRTMFALLPPEGDPSRAESEESERAFGRRVHRGRACLAGLDGLSWVGPGIVEDCETKS